jgi:hypothetical protein
VLGSLVMLQSQERKEEDKKTARQASPWFSFRVPTCWLAREDDCASARVMLRRLSWTRVQRTSIIQIFKPTDRAKILTMKIDQRSEEIRRLLSIALDRCTIPNPNRIIDPIRFNKLIQDHLLPRLVTIHPGSLSSLHIQLSPRRTIAANGQRSAVT